MIKWIKQNRFEALVIFLILLLASFFRFYHLQEYMTFLGDEGRDVLVVKRILVDHDFPLLGPPTSVGDIYLGPLYYYMMAIAMTISWLNPVAAAVMVAVIGILTVALIYYFGREWFGIVAGAVSAALYAISPVNIIYSRSSWNPNPAPFFALLIVLGFYKARKTGNFLWLILTGIAMAFITQMHYLALILFPVIGLLWLYEFFVKVKKEAKYKYFWLGSLGGLASFLFLMTPLVIFDFKYNFQNYYALSTFFGNRETTVNLNILNTLGRIFPLYFDKLIGRYIAVEIPWLTVLIALIILIPIFWFIFQIIRYKLFYWPSFVLSLWLIIGVLGLTLYKQTVYDHYLGFLNPAPFILYGSLIVLCNRIIINKIRLISYAIFGIFTCILMVNNLQSSPLKSQPNNQLQRTQEIAHFIINQAKGKPFNFALIAAHNYDSAYQYYLDIYGYKPKVVPIDVTDQLFVVCEDSVCNPANNAKYEIAGFGMSKIDKMDIVDGLKVYKLVANPSGQP